MRATSSRFAATVSTVAWSVALGLAAAGSGPSAFAGDAARAVHPLHVATDGRHLVQADGRPFFYLTDTAWSLFHRLTREEADLYLRNRAAAELGLTIALLPTWGDKWHSRQNEPGPRVFTDPATARDFARFVGRRYGSRPVIFVLGGDRNVETAEDLAITRAFAEGLKESAGCARHVSPSRPRPPMRMSATRNVGLAVGARHPEG